jgi:hypothetical protein
MKWGTVLLLAALSIATGCSDDDNSPTDGGGGDEGANNVDGAGVDLFGADLSCMYGFFPGFGGASATERRYDCPCGCTIDPFTSAASVSGIWNGTNMHATFTPTTTGLEVGVDGTAGTPAIGGLASFNSTGPFFLDGDFDLLVDYDLVGTPPPNAHAILRVDNLKSGLNGVYTVERLTTAASANQYSAALAGILPVAVATTATSGTLELKRNGFTLQAIADGSMITQYTGAVQDRLAILVTVGLDTCGGSCAFTVRWKNLRLNSGALVDRQ